jgi:hypothetical protein
VNVIDEMEDPSAEQGTSALRTLNQLAGQWDRDGIRIGWQVVSSLSDTLPIDYQDERAVLFNLAVELAGSYGMDPLPRVLQIARKTYDGLAKAHAQVVECKLDHLPQADSAYINGSIETG